MTADEGKRWEIEAERVAARLVQARERIAEVIFGQERVIEQVLVTLLCGGHGLLVGLPGLAKTRLVETLATVFDLSARRLQCTPDLMPADILGSEILDEGEHGRRAFRFVHGPIFCQLLMADEINRASPRTQSALLQAMQEHEVSVAGQTYPLPAPFHVLATQNPIEQEGTYPLPEAQLDRFLMQIDVDYPDRDAERRMLLATTSVQVDAVANVFSADELLAAQRLVRALPIGEDVLEGILDVVRQARPSLTEIEDIRRHVSWGPGPRAAQALSLACRALALLQGRYSPSLDDVQALLRPVLQHRMALSFAARADGVVLEDVLSRLSEILD
ncbi:MAG: MoxR family ATPase [Alphaproteobacteria bacterium]|nr:MAG: MoxR family ATPase [Alphaproteobacteria bacterium]